VLEGFPAIDQLSSFCQEELRRTATRYVFVDAIFAGIGALAGKLDQHGGEHDFQAASILLLFDRGDFVPQSCQLAQHVWCVPAHLAGRNRRHGPDSSSGSGVGGFRHALERPDEACSLAFVPQLRSNGGNANGKRIEVDTDARVPRRHGFDAYRSASAKWVEHVLERAHPRLHQRASDPGVHVRGIAVKAVGERVGIDAFACVERFHEHCGHARVAGSPARSRPGIHMSEGPALRCRPAAVFAPWAGVSLLAHHVRVARNASIRDVSDLRNGLTRASVRPSPA